MCIIFHNIRQAFVPRPHPLRQLPLETRKKTVAQGGPRRLGYFSRCFLKVFLARCDSLLPLCVGEAPW